MVEDYKKFFKNKEEIIFLEHIADVEFVIFAKSVRRLFELSMKAIFSVMFDLNEIKEEITKQLVVKSESLPALLYDFLDDLLVLFDSEFFVPKRFLNFEYDEKEFRVILTIIGDEAKNYKRTSDVKAITYHNYIVERFDDWLYCHIVADT